MDENIKKSIPAGADPPALPENDAASLYREVAELKNAFEQFVSSEKPAMERLHNELASTSAQRDEAAGELQKLRRSNAVAELAAAYSFGDAEYLDYILYKNRIDPSDTAAAGNFMQNYRAAHPHNFNLPVKSGAGSRPESRRSGVYSGGNRMDALENLLSCAPEII